MFVHGVRIRPELEKITRVVKRNLDGMDHVANSPVIFSNVSSQSGLRATYFSSLRGYKPKLLARGHFIERHSALSRLNEAYSPTHLRQFSNIKLEG
jgi:hypothetical protein